MRNPTTHTDSIRPSRTRQLTTMLVASMILVASTTIADTLVTTCEFKHSDFAWAPDGLTIYTVGLKADDVEDQITSVDAAGADPVHLTSDSSVHSSLSVGPGGEVLYTKDLGFESSQICMQPPGGGSEATLTSGPDLHSKPQMSPDGTTLMYMKVSGPLPAMPPTELYTMPVTGGPETALGVGTDYLTPTWMPDGSGVVAVKSDPGGVLQLFMVMVGGGEMQLTFSPLHKLQPAVSPDGAMIAFMTWDSMPSSPADIAVVPSFGGPEMTIVSDGFSHGFPQWAPDASEIAFQTVTPLGFVEIHACAPDGSGMHMVTSGADFRLFPKWSPSGDRIAYLATDNIADPKVWTVPTSAASVGDMASSPPVAAPVLMQIAPNPLSRSTGTSIRFDTAVSGSVTVDIFDVQGRVVRSVASEMMGAGSHRYAWDGHGTDGRTMTPGIYFARVVTAGVTSTGKMVLAP